MARAAVTWVGLGEMLLANVARRGPERQSTAPAALARAARCSEGKQGKMNTFSGRRAGKQLVHCLDCSREPRCLLIT